ncbi:MAG TPA: hypothetical protein VFS67_14590 [Polyangiaceae bacterium]|nr:hypothetical protein [Polyangiaceae bacterium]
MPDPACSAAEVRLPPQPAENLDVARVLGRIAALLEAQEASSFHVRACHDAAAQVRQLREPPPQIVEQRGCAGLEQLPVVTERRGALAGRRIVRGGEHECGRQDGVSPRESLPDAAGESAATVLALRTAAGQLGSEAPIEAIETHLSWVFLTRCHAYKLKKPARSEHFDYTTVGARRAACETELQLNRRLAASVYLGVVPVRCNGTGRHVEGNGEIVDWLLKMRRLPRDSMLNVCIQRQAVSVGQLMALAQVLTRFYAAAPRAGWSGAEYRRTLAARLESKRALLTLPRHELDPGLVRSVCEQTERWLERHVDEVAARAPLVREAHGDLRPEHICLEAEPVIIDCLDFDRQLRLLDPLSELAFLDLECRRLGNDWIGPQLAASYARLAGDAASLELQHFYASYHALIRAGLAVSRTDEPGADLDKWRARARSYLEFATPPAL